MNILVLNAGSSSLKFDLYEHPDKLLMHGLVERVASMADALDGVFAKLAGMTVEAVGHRVVHGGDRYFKSVLIDDMVEAAIDGLSALAPLHNPHNLEGIRAARAKLPNVPHVAYSIRRFITPCRRMLMLTDCLTNIWQKRKSGAMASTAFRIATSPGASRNCMAKSGRTTG